MSFINALTDHRWLSPYDHYLSLLSLGQRTVTPRLYLPQCILNSWRFRVGTFSYIVNEVSLAQCGVCSQRQSLTWRRQSLTWQIQSLTWQRQSLTWQRQSLTWQRQSLTWQRQSLTWQRQSLTWQKRNRGVDTDHTVDGYHCLFMDLIGMVQFY